MERRGVCARCKRAHCAVCYNWHEREAKTFTRTDQWGYASFIQSTVDGDGMLRTENEDIGEFEHEPSECLCDECKKGEGGDATGTS
jgi:hypothetical protein